MYQSKLHTISRTVLFTRVACKSANTWRCQLSEALRSVNPCGLSPSFSKVLCLSFYCYYAMWSGLFGGGVACVYVAYNYTTWGWVGMGGMGRADETFVTPNKMATQPFPPNFHMEGFTPISALLFGLLYSRFSCAQL